MAGGCVVLPPAGICSGLLMTNLPDSKSCAAGALFITVHPFVQGFACYRQIKDACVKNVINNASEKKN
jgi:hypothetical protein